MNRFVVFLIAAVAATTLAADRADIRDNLEEVLPPADRPALLVFFDPACPSCAEDLFEMRYWAERSGLVLEIIGVATGVRKGVAAFLEKHGYFRPVVLDRKARLRRRFKVDLVPSMIVLYGGRVVHRDDWRRTPEERREEVKRCLTGLCSR
jgi:peroxiredoxin